MQVWLGRTRRVVKFKGMDDMLAVANRNRLLAGETYVFPTMPLYSEPNPSVQWKAWLTHTRSEPPTLQVILFVHCFSDNAD